MAEIDRPRDGETEDISLKIDQYITFVKEADDLLMDLAQQVKGTPVKDKLIGMTLAHASAYFHEILPECLGMPTDEGLRLSIELIWQWKGQRLHSMPYADYLLSEHWQIQRKAALERARHSCQICNSKTNLNVHHRTYERRGYEREDDLIVLCKSCHQLFHDNGKLQVEE